MSNAETIPDALVSAAAGDRAVRTIEHDGRCQTMTYAELLESALRAGGTLRARGLDRGDRVALVVPEVNDFTRAFFGISVAGLVPVPLVPPGQAADIPTFAGQSRHLLAASRAAAVITTRDVAPLLKRSSLGPVPMVLTTDVLGAGPGLSAPAAVAPLDIALLQFTSGSTAVPKGVVLTHANLSANIAGIAGSHGVSVRRSDVCVSWLPLHHDMGLIGMLLASTYAQIDVVIMSPLLFLKRPTAWLQTISSFRGSISFAPNFAYDLCLRRVKASQIATLDLSCWRIAGCGAEPVRPDTLQEFARRFAPAGFEMSRFMPSYGLAEHSLAVTLSRQGIKVDVVDATLLARESRAVRVVNGSAATRPTVRLAGCGRPLPGHEVRIVDERGRCLRPRHVGQIVLRGPSVMDGYFQDAAASSKALVNGWLQTGDLGYMADGELFVCGRTKDLIVRHGKKYHPPDLESAIANLDGVRPSGVVVFGINRPDAADEVVAVLEARASSASGDVVEAVRRRVRETAGLELDRVIVIPPGTIPRTTSGKVRRAETRARLETGALLARG